MRSWYSIGLVLLLLSMSPLSVCAQGTPNAQPAGAAQQSYLAGVVAMTDLDYQTAVTKFEQAVQLAPTNAVYVKMLAFARRKLRETHQ